MENKKIEELDSGLLRRKSAMVLFRLEEELGAFISRFQQDVDRVSESVKENISEREIGQGRAVNKSSLKDLVQASYLDELFTLAKEVTKDTSDQARIERLKDSCAQLSAYEIRNTLAHPNRPFIDSYWYRVAAIAADPVIEQLGMYGVRQSLVSAENNEISDPPEDWLKSNIWSIPNNLPERIDHGITGLVGRKSERDALTKLLEKPRVSCIAVVAPGGVGKTALVLDLLKDVVASQTSAKWVDGVIFVSMKTEKLTADGLQKLSAAETIEELKLELAYAFEIFDGEICEDLAEVIEKFKSERILLVIDNLETLLRDSPRIFDDFVLDLPDAWRILVTSRVSINGASVLPLEALQDKFGALLVRIYSDRKGISIGDEGTCLSIAKKCYCNPLAIRLSVDLFANGKAIPDSISVANKEIAEFSYSNLIDSISGPAIEILEALFVDGQLTRTDLCELLEKDADEIAGAVAELTKTSLVGRLVEGFSEKYELSLSIRDLLVRNPKNIEARSRIQDRINRRHLLVRQIKTSQKDRNVSVLNQDYIPDGISENLQLLLKDVNSATKKHASVSEATILHRRMAAALGLYDESSAFHFGYARILEKMLDTIGAERHYKESIRIDSKNPVSVLALAKMYLNNSRYEDAEAFYESLVKDGWDGLEKSKDREFTLSVLTGYYYALLYQHKHESLLEKTKKWKECADFRGVRGAFRAAAYKRSVENVVHSDTSKTMDSLRRAMVILDDVIRQDGYFDVVIGQCLKLIEELEFVLSRRAYHSNQDFCDISLSFVERHISELSDRSKGGDIIEKAVNTFSKLNVNNNPINSGRWRGVKDLEGASTYLEASGYTIVKVTKIPVGKGYGTTYIFAADDNVEYFLHYEYFKAGRQAWASLNVGDLLAIKVSPARDHKHIQASEILIVA